ncbi:pimeloyl-[acyl-carrier protein] methyl ester esterase [Thiosulfatimonas sediminis]|uniref:Pimeloyl-[acyl-carrier protein] methyl ester esterase n=1 Tax=Thiosulfatimonas sediminis TaxID=2675054 RepID=A0A6F8PS00_9GAMM|nr:pimeloyl-ACP methyl ester esterase BioH [Thiosulfatimonas sediminis]BBP44798.1 pimeloyl-[acyl-carrier protein] methyl ester esterase [Thiosulfatimonas sediminis]
MLSRLIIEQPNRPKLTFIHGWGAQNSVWQDWAQQTLGAYFELHLIELPGFGQSNAVASQANDQMLAQTWVDAILEAMPQKSHLLGWSLGGLLAQQIAIQQPERVQSLICLASTPRFTQNDDWKWAVSPKLMADFMRSVQADSAATLKSFWTLQMQGSEIPRQQIKQFVQRMQDYQLPTLSGLTQGLRLLKYFDFREQANELPMPVLWLLGEHDPLIPQAFIAEFSTIQRQAQVKILAGAAHTPFASHPQQTADAIRHFLAQR